MEQVGPGIYRLARSPIAELPSDFRWVLRKPLRGNAEFEAAILILTPSVANGFWCAVDKFSVEHYAKKKMTPPFIAGFFVEEVNVILSAIESLLKRRLIVVTRRDIVIPTRELIEHFTPI